MTAEIVALDLETTGVDISKDAIVQIGLVKFNSETFEEVDSRAWYILPDNGAKMNPGAAEKTGLTDEFIAENGVSIKDIWDEAASFIGDCDMLTFNGNHFDVPMLYNELSRNALSFKFSGRTYYDSRVIELNRHRTTLSDTYKRYYGSDFENTHDALADVRATIKVFKAQSEATTEDITDDAFKLLSPEGMVHFDDSKKCIVFSKGKYAGAPTNEVCKTDADYIKWIFRTFSKITCDTIRDEWYRCRASDNKAE